MPYGGAGSLHACQLAERLGIRSVLVVPNPGLLCAWGALASPWRREFSRTVLGRDQLEAVFLELEEQAREKMGAELRTERWADLRYRGQGSALVLPYTPDRLALEQAFHQQHQLSFGYSRADFAIEVVTLRVRAEAQRVRPEWRARWGETRSYLIRMWWDIQGTLKMQVCMCFHRSGLRPGYPVLGPCRIVSDDATVVAPPGWQASVDIWGNLRLARC